MAEILQHKVRIKKWEKDFVAKNGRIPSKADVKADKAIAKAYKTYNALKKLQTEQTSTSHKADENPPSGRSKVPVDGGVDGEPPGDRGRNKHTGSSQSRTTKGHSRHINSERDRAHQVSGQPESTAIDVFLTDDEDSERVDPVHNAELGPTPQANGKVLSMFDMVFSPPESSPVRQRQRLLEDSQSVRNTFVSSDVTTEQDGSFKTPTKAVKRIEFSHLTPSKSSSVADRLRHASNDIATTPKSNQRELYFETPQYLGKNARNAFSDVKHDAEMSPSKTNMLCTPSKVALSQNFQVSPSPLKPQRHLAFGASKRVADIFQEYKSLEFNKEFEAQKLEIESEINDKEPEPDTAVSEDSDPADIRKRKKATTQKRTTRRWKIKPREEAEKGTGLEGKNVHEELLKLHTAEQQHLAKYVADETESSEEGDMDDSAEDEPSSPQRKKQLSTKIHSISNNYQRLKINDPRSKRFKQRMKRR